MRIVECPTNIFASGELRMNTFSQFSLHQDVDVQLGKEGFYRDGLTKLRTEENSG